MKRPAQWPAFCLPRSSSKIQVLLQILSLHWESYNAIIRSCRECFIFILFTTNTEHHGRQRQAAVAYPSHIYLGYIR